MEYSARRSGVPNTVSQARRRYSRFRKCVVAMRCGKTKDSFRREREARADTRH
ncbi:hypothetical protein BRPE64_ACDS13560 [Caballeronia insecticola]|uniref:Uncharacterized protein n=1 Tax=Caballeronia insecticola TaxID=758793 RepID=R4WQB9_9BURK|nr:hypothetical protein BRPE64_ACDS13560 [Caballeronia insecticola]